MSDYEFPPDEYDAPAQPGQSVGIHRMRRSTWSRLWPYLVVVLICGLLAYGAVTWFASRTPHTTQTPVAGAPSATSSAPSKAPSKKPKKDATTPADDATAPDEDATTPEDEATTPDEGVTTPEDETTEAEPTATELNRAVPIRVLNATRTQGLAASGVNKLKTIGWSSAVAANYTGGAINTTAVWYKGAEFAAEAAQIAADLGVGSPTLVPDLSGPISVILAGDFRS